MADYWTHLSFEIEFPDETVAAKALAAIEGWAAALRPDWYEDEPAQSEESPAVPESLAQYREDFLGVQMEREGARIWVHDDGGGPNVDMLAAVIQEAFKQFHPTGQVGFEWSNDCTKPRLDAFGGGAMMIWADDVMSVNTCELLAQFEKARSTPPAAPTAEH